MISVIMLTYNREKFVSRAIESVLAQTHPDFEFIIVDNGSTDQSGKIADEYAVKDPRIRVIHRERGNIGAGRNTGLDAARGEYITFIDDDDYLEPDYLRRLYQSAAEHNADIAVCGSWREIDGVRQPKYVFDGVFDYSGEDAVCEMLKREKFNSGTPTKLIAKKIFSDLRYSCNSKYDDIEMTYKLLAQAEKVTVSGVPLYICTRHDKNNSAGTVRGEAVPTGQIEAYLTAFRERTQWLTERFPDKADFWLYTELSYALSMYENTKEIKIREQLSNVLRHHQTAWLASEQFYTDRDKDLTKLGREASLCL